MLTTVENVKLTPSVMRAEINQSNLLIQARHQLDLISMRLFLIALSTINPHFSVKDKYFDKDFKDAFIPTSTLSNLLGSSRYLNMIPKACVKLDNVTITLPDGSLPRNLYGLFHHIEYKAREGLYFRFRHSLRPHILDLLDTRGFTAIKLKYLLSLSSTYAVRLLEIMLQFQNLRRFKEAMEINRTLTIEQLRFMLNVPDSAYKGRVDNLKRHVIDIPAQEINKNTPYILRYRPVKRGNKIVAFKFMLATHKLLEMAPDSRPNFTNSAIESLMNLGFNEFAARTIFNRCKDEMDCQRRIQGALFLFRRQKKNIRNRLGFLRSAIEGKWNFIKKGQSEEDNAYDVYEPDENIPIELEPLELKKPKKSSKSRSKKKNRAVVDTNEKNFTPTASRPAIPSDKRPWQSAGAKVSTQEKFDDIAADESPTQSNYGRASGQEKRGGGWSTISEIMADNVSRLIANSNKKSSNQGAGAKVSAQENRGVNGTNEEFERSVSVDRCSKQGAGAKVSAQENRGVNGTNEESERSVSVDRRSKQGAGAKVSVQENRGVNAATESPMQVDDEDAAVQKLVSTKEILRKKILKHPISLEIAQYFRGVYPKDDYTTADWKEKLMKRLIKMGEKFRNSDIKEIFMVLELGDAMDQRKELNDKTPPENRPTVTLEDAVVKAEMLPDSVNDGLIMMDVHLIDIEYGYLSKEDKKEAIARSLAIFKSKVEEIGARKDPLEIEVMNEPKFEIPDKPPETPEELSPEELSEIDKVSAEVAEKIVELTKIITEIRKKYSDPAERNPAAFKVAREGMAPLIKKIQENDKIPKIKNIEVHHAAGKGATHETADPIYPRFIWVKGRRILVNHLKDTVANIFTEEMRKYIEETCSEIYGVTVEEAVILCAKNFGDDFPDPAVLPIEHLYEHYEQFEQDKK